MRIAEFNNLLVKSQKCFKLVLSFLKFVITSISNTYPNIQSFSFLIVNKELKDMKDFLKQDFFVS